MEKNIVEKEKRLIGYDVMRIVAATMVVCIHSNVFFLQKAVGTWHWIAVMILTALCVVSVPLFFMVSGAGNLVKNDIISFRGLFMLKIPKVFIPFAIWSLIYVCLRIFTGKIELSPHAFLSLVHEPAYYQFWFMYSLLGMYLLIPVFQYLIIKSDRKILQYIILVWVVTSLLLPLCQRYVPGFKISSHFNMVLLEGYWGYFFVGGYLRKYPLNREKFYGVFLLVGGTVITLVSALLEWSFTPAEKYYGYVYCAYLLPGAAMMSIGMFLLLQHINISGKTRKVVYYLSGLTMGVFYTHTILINGYEMVFKNISPTFGHAIVKLIVVVAIAILLCMLLKSIKPLRKYLL